MAAFYRSTIPTPVGDLEIWGNGAAVSGLLFPQWRHGEGPPEEARRDAQAFAEARAQLGAYFSGELAAFELELTPTGTPFQREVWRALGEIPFGETESYGALARRIGRPGASRAVGLANGSNPVCIIVPCHRVIGADGSLTGYGGGIERKRWLLAHERRFASSPQHQLPGV
ncbi:MAG: methylated-DNA--[protein]-cysteine S-methyltransferase [Thermoanaerobaculia bacterium]